MSVNEPDWATQTAQDILSLGRKSYFNLVLEKVLEHAAYIGLQQVSREGGDRQAWADAHA